MNTTFLQADWRDLFMLSFRAKPELLAPYLPVGTELDTYEGSPLLSVVAFRFQKLKVLGIPIPFCQNFSQINLRFYVYRKTPEGRVPGVVFIKELCPLALVSMSAKLLYRENYHTTQTSFQNHSGQMRYRWTWDGKENYLGAEVSPARSRANAGTIEEFIIERFHGYRSGRKGKTVEFQVAHPTWRLREMKNSRWLIDVASMYGAELAQAFTQAPVSTILVDGGPVAVGWRKCLEY